MGGYVRLVINDAASDSDGDGLGALLEANMCTCDSESTPTCGMSCDPITNPFIRDVRDSDGDGILDGVELLGTAGDYSTYPDDFPQYLPRWGANPLHKDIFLELDWRADATQLPASQVSEIIDAYNAPGTQSALGNRDGLDGIDVHIDCGIATTGGETTHGDWGGASLVGPTDYKTPSYQEFSHVRRGIFHRGVLTAGGGNGENTGDAFRSNTNGFTIAHELGHNLHINHGGRFSTGRQNAKPHYLSLENYAFQSGVHTQTFSQGRFRNVSLNPSDLCESDGLRTSNRSHVQYLEGAPYYYMVEATCTGYCGIDWNRDGTISPCSTRVEAPVTFHAGESEIGRQYYYRGHPDFAYADPDPDTTPSVTRAFGRLYIGFRHNAGPIRLQYTSDSFDNCPTYAGCASWYATDVATSSDRRGPAIATHHVNGHEYLVVVYGDNGGLRSLILDSNHNVLLNQVIPGSSGITYEPSVLVSEANSTSTELWLAFRTGTPGGPGPVLGSTLGQSLEWSPSATQVDSNGPIVAYAVLAAAGSPNGEVLLLSRYEAGRYVPAWYDSTAVNTWSRNMTTRMERNNTRSLPEERAGLAYIEHSGLADDGRWFYIWQSDSQPNRGHVRMSMSRGSTGSDLLFTLTGAYDNNAFRTSGGGVALYSYDPFNAESNLRLATTFTGSPASRQPSRPMLEFRPLGDGIVNMSLTDDNDYEVMERGLCAALYSCGNNLCNATGSVNSCLGHR